jgi:hypothetical protein
VTYEDQWKCRVCRVGQVVPSLARDCERRHGVDPKGLDDPVKMVALCSGVGVPEEGAEVA